MPKIFTIGRNLTKFWQKISLHSFFETRCRTILHRPVSDSPTVFSLARSKILLTFLTCFIQGRPPHKKTRMQTPPFGVVYRTYIFSVKFRKGVIKTVYCYVHRNFQQNIPLFRAISGFVVGPIAVNSWRIMSNGNLEKCFCRDGTLDMRWQSRVLGVYLFPARRLEVWGSVVSSPGGIWGGAPAANDFWMFCAILHVCASTIPKRTSLESCK